MSEGKKASEASVALARSGKEKKAAFFARGELIAERGAWDDAHPLFTPPREGADDSSERVAIREGDRVHPKFGRAIDQLFRMARPFKKGEIRAEMDGEIALLGVVHGCSIKAPFKEPGRSPPLAKEREDGAVFTLSIKIIAGEPFAFDAIRPSERDDRRVGPRIAAGIFGQRLGARAEPPNQHLARLARGGRADIPHRLVPKGARRMVGLLEDGARRGPITKGGP